MRAAISLLLLVAACEPIFEEPPLPTARIVSPVPGESLVHVDGFLIEVSLESCDALAGFTFAVNGQQIATIDDELPFDSPFEASCDRALSCAFLPIDRVLATGQWDPLSLQAEVRCAEPAFRVTADSVSLSAQPFTESVRLGSAGVTLARGPAGGLVVAGDGPLALVDYGADGSVLRQPSRVDGRAFEAAGALYHFAPCAGSECASSPGFLTRLSPDFLQPVGDALALGCEPFALVAGPAADQITALSNCGGLQIVVASSDLTAVTRSSAPLAGREPAHRVGDSVVLLADDGSSLSRVEIDGQAGLSVTALDVAVNGTEQTALADGAGWLAMVRGLDVFRIDADTGVALGEPTSLVSEALVLAAIRGTDEVLVGDTRQGYKLERSGFLGVAGGPSRAMRLVNGRYVAYLVEGGTYYVDPIRTDTFFDDDRFGPFPASWTPRAALGTGDAWLHQVWETPSGPVLMSLDLERGSN